MARIKRIKAEGVAFCHVVSSVADYEWSAPGAAAKGDNRVLKGLTLEDFKQAKE